MAAGDDRTPARSSIDDIIELYKKDVDRGLLREALKLTPSQRLQRLVELTCFGDRLQLARSNSNVDRALPRENLQLTLPFL